MKILLSPQVRDNKKIWYKIEHQKITATINDVSDTFDFSDMPNGELELYDKDGNSIIQTRLEEVPIVTAKKTNGQLFVEILFSIDSVEKNPKLLFPEWVDIDGFNELMKELTVSKSKRSEKNRDEKIREKDLKENSERHSDIRKKIIEYQQSLEAE